MAPISPAGKAALAYWGEINRAVADRASTADIWSAIRAAQATAGGPMPAVTIQGVNEVRSMAAGIRNSSEALNAARDLAESSGLAQSVTGAMVSTAPWSRSQEIRTVMGQFQVRFAASVTDAEGNTTQQWLTQLFPAGGLPTTVGDLVDALGAYSLATGSLSEGGFEGIGDIQIIEV